ncbi:MAG: NUDIX domain-containing protein [Betaproteobacteria bacterium]|nr:NUDIX domain-containing protein [Betaproteobacteria bacterium]
MQAEVDVAVGILFDAHGRILFAQRPAGKAYAGWWEFPGGKVEAGESVGEALARELHEELGITVAQSTPWLIRRHVYPHARVRLWFRRVDARLGQWDGQPFGREGQELVWWDRDAGELALPAPLLPATEPLLAWLRY